jgi:hypothetical protein
MLVGELAGMALRSADVGQAWYVDLWFELRE